MKTLVYFFTFLICVFANNVPDCIENFLRNSNSRGGGRKCNKLIQNFTASLKSEFSQNLIGINNKKCVQSAINDYKVDKFFLKNYAEELRSNFTVDEHYGEVLDIYKKNYIEAIRVLCLSQEEFRTNFNIGYEFYKAVAKTEEDHVKLCKQKFFIDNNFIKPEDYNIDRTSINATNCKKVFKEVQHDAYNINVSGEESGNVFSKASKCQLKKFDEKKILLEYDSFKVVAHFELTEKQTNILRSKYVDNKKATNRFVLECARDQV